MDPDGREVYIFGDQAREAFASLQNNTSLELSINAEGKVTIVGGEAQNRNDVKLAKAINSTKIRVEIYADKSNNDNETGGAYMGTSYFKETKSAESCNHINMEKLVREEKKYKAPLGSGVEHEITEGYRTGVFAIRRKRDIMPAIRAYTEWDDNLPINQSTTQTTPSTQKIETTSLNIHNSGYQPLYPQDYDLYMRAHKWATPEPHKYKNSH